MMHSGSKTMWYSVVSIAAKRGFAVIAVTNLTGFGLQAGTVATNADASQLAEQQAKPAKD